MPIFFLSFNFSSPKLNLIFLVDPFKEISLRSELSSPPSFRIQGGILSVMDGGGGRKSLCLILDSRKPSRQQRELVTAEILAGLKVLRTL